MLNHEMVSDWPSICIRMLALKPPVAGTLTTAPWVRPTSVLATSGIAEPLESVTVKVKVHVKLPHWIAELVGADQCATPLVRCGWPEFTVKGSKALIRFELCAVS